MSANLTNPGSLSFDEFTTCREIADASPVPLAQLEGPAHILRYANSAFCRLTSRSWQELQGIEVCRIGLASEHCGEFLDRAYRTGEAEVHTERRLTPEPLFRSYAVWAMPAIENRPRKVILQVTDATALQQDAVAMNEALLLAAVRQHELAEQAVLLNIELQSEIVARQRAESEIVSLAFFDPLTQLPNRRLLMDRFHHALAASARTLRHGAVLFLDLDGFKNLNDLRGHDAGDLLLQEVAQRIASCIRDSDTAARFGGDEFVVILQNLSEDFVTAVAETRSVANKLLAVLADPFLLAGYQHRTSGSIGAALFSKSRESTNDLLKRADLALYRAKADGGNAVRLFDTEMRTIVTASAMLDADLKQALAKNELFLLFQPQVDEQGRVTGSEALLRWQHPHRGLLLPSGFIPFAEESGFIVTIGLWVLNAACRQLVAWALSPETARLRLSVNISAQEFRHSEFVPRVLKALNDSGADPRKLMLELTESGMFGTAQETRDKMTALKAIGVSFSIDDFGIGYSSLSSLRNLPLDELKIDRSFVKDVVTNGNDAAIARSVIALGQSLDLSVIAEGVETQAQRNFLATHGCLAFQGFLFGRPAAPDNLLMH